MLHLFHKDKLPNIFSNQFIPNFITFIFAFILTHKKYSPILTGISIFILYFYSYFIHKLLHYLPNMLNLHLNNHHGSNKNNDLLYNFLNLSIELFTNIMFFVIFYYIQKILQINFIPEIIIFYYGFIYVSIHIINYSIFHASKIHVLHHETTNKIQKNKTCNYGPDLVDHIFKTNYNNKVENYNHILPNILMAFLLTYYFYKPQIF
jgi:hypothetical protein